MKRLRSKLTYSNVISTLCLFLLVGGGSAFAASQFGKETIGSRAIKKESIGPNKLTPAAKAALVGPKGATGPAGPAGPQGPQGPQGPKGATGIATQRLVQVTGSGSASAECAPGETLTAGGAFTSPGGALKGSYPNEVTPGSPGRWTAQTVAAGESVTVRILCASP